MPHALTTRVDLEPPPATERIARYAKTHDVSALNDDDRRTLALAAETLPAYAGHRFRTDLATVGELAVEIVTYGSIVAQVMENWADRLEDADELRADVAAMRRLLGFPDETEEGE